MVLGVKYFSTFNETFEYFNAIWIISLKNGIPRVSFFWYFCYKNGKATRELTLLTNSRHSSRTHATHATHATHELKLLNLLMNSHLRYQPTQPTQPPIYVCVCVCVCV